MDEPSSAKRRKTGNINDLPIESKINKQWSSNVEISAIPVKPDKLQKLRRIATKVGGTPVTDDGVASSANSSRATSPRPENLPALSEPVDPAELFARLTVLVRDENKENLTLKSGDGNLQAGDEDNMRLKSLEEDVKGQSMSDKILNIPMRTEEFYAVLRKMINEKIKQLEDNYNEIVIPNLEKKIKSLESENNYLHEHAKRLQEMLTKLAIEHQKQQKQKPDQTDAAVQVGSFEPPPLTPVGSAAVQTVALPNKPAPVIHVVDGVSDIYKSPSTASSHAIQSTTLASQYALRGAGMVNGIRHTATASTGHVFTSSAGQPRMYSEAPYKPGSHPNAVVAPLSNTTFPRPGGPITATVYPQPQGLPTSPSTLGIRRGSTPIQTPPHRVPYSPQPPNGVMIRTAAQPTVQYVMNPEKSTGQMLGGRQKSSSFQGPPPSYSIANARPQQQQVSYRPGTTTNPPQVNGVRHYAVRQSPPSQGGMVGTPVRSPAGPPPLVRAQPNMRPQINNSPRYQTPHVIRQRPPYSQNTPGNDPRVQPTTVTPRNPNVPPPPPQSSPSQTNGVVRDLPPPTPAVSISGASSGIVLSWNMNIPEGSAPIDSYQLFAYQNSNQMANTHPSWKKLGIVKALPLPMACTLTQFVSGSMYSFAVRAIDIHGRAGSYSTPCTITLPSENEK